MESSRWVRSIAVWTVATVVFCADAGWRSLTSAMADDGPAAIKKATADLQDPSSTVRERAAVVLVQRAPDVREAIPALTAALADRFQPVRWNAAKALGIMGPEAASAVPALMKAVALPDWSGSAQVMAASALGRMGPAAKEAVPVLADVLAKDQQSIVRREAALTLAVIGPEAKAARPALKTALADENGFVRVAAALALWKVGPDAAGVPVLIEALKDQTLVGTRIAADALAEIGPGAKAAVPALTGALDDPASCARVAAARALWLIAQDSDGMPALVTALKDPFPEVRDRAAETLGLIVKAKEDGYRKAGVLDRAQMLQRMNQKERQQLLSANDDLKEYVERKAAPPSTPTTLVFQAEDCSGPPDAIVKDKAAPNKWWLAKNYVSWAPTVLVSPSVTKDRATSEEGAPVLHTHVTGIPNGAYAVTLGVVRAVGISLDAGKTWRKLEGDPLVGVFDIKNGTFDLWVDDRYVYSKPESLGPSYYDTITFTPTEAPTAAAVHGWAKERVRERLSRGVNAARLAEGGVYVNWRLLDDDPKDSAFDVYRHVEGAQPQRMNDKPITRTTDFVDRSAPPDKPCRYSVTLAGKTEDRVPSPAAPAAAADPPYTSIKFQGDYRAYQLAIADLDGDGRYDYVIKRPHYGIWNGLYLWHRSTETYKLEAYDADGKFLWRYDMGWGIELGPWHSPFVAYDLDGDGRAEVACKAADADPRDADGHVDSGPEYVAVLDGLTGKVRCRATWPNREGFTPQYDWLNQMTVGYLDGNTPCLIVERGTYGLQIVDAHMLQGDRLEPLWHWNNLGAGKDYWGQGAHTIHAADVDGDGRDEVIIGSSVIDDNGASLWSTGYGHVDQCFVGDIDPLRPGLEVFYTVEPGRMENGVCLVDARNGKVIWGLRKQSFHVGFGLACDVDPTHPGCECWACEDPKGDPKGRRYEGKPPNWLFSAQGEILAEGGTPGPISMGGASRAAWWDADVQRELLGRNQIRRYGGGTCPPATEGDVIAVGDVIGDWREEIVTALPGELRIYSTRIPARDRRVCLMQDPIYRLCVTTNSQAYYSLPQTSACLSSTVPDIMIDGATTGLLPGQETPCTVTVVAPSGAALAGALQLSADPGAVLTPSSFAVQATPGQVVRFPFTVRAAAASPFAGRSSLKVSAVLKPNGGEPVTEEFSFPLIAAPLSGVPLAEAEDIAEQVGGQVQIRTDKVGVSGKAFSHWNDKGHRLTWQINVPQAGRYHLVVRCSCTNDAERSLLVDGKALPGVERVRFPSTGGYGSKADEWSNVAVRLPDGQLATWDLSAGPHKITMESTNGTGLNLDQLAWVPAP